MLYDIYGMEYKEHIEDLNVYLEDNGIKKIEY
jgi:hypothetical protein